MKKITKKIIKNIKAFTILETLITILAISLMIVGPVAFVAKSFHYSDFINHKIIATGLSQEALELATSLRNLDLDEFQKMASKCSKSCLIDWGGNGSTPTYSKCESDSECQLFLLPNSDGSRSYRHIYSSEASDFYRYIEITKNGSQSYTVEANTYSYNNGIKLEVKLKKIIFAIVVK